MIPAKRGLTVCALNCPLGDSPAIHRLFRRTVKNKGIPTQIFSSETQNSRFCHYTPQNLDFFIFHIFFGNFTIFWTDSGCKRCASSTSPKSRTDTLRVLLHRRNSPQVRAADPLNLGIFSFETIKLIPEKPLTNKC